jgi:YjbE family integral membrane protein
MHFAELGAITLDMAFISSLLSIIIIDLVLAGDNAVVIAMAVRSLPKKQRIKGIFYGAAAAVLLRVVLTFFVAEILTVNYVKLVGGIVILWIAVKLFVEDEEAAVTHKESASLWHAIRFIVVADITMSVDNMLAVGGASQGNLFLLLFGLGLSIPLIVFASSLLSTLMEKYPLIIYMGAAILGAVGGDMILTDPVVAAYGVPSTTVKYAIKLLFAAGVLGVGQLWLRRDLAKQARAGDAERTKD